MNPKVFISYSHDSQSHKDWVESLAVRLRRNGIDASLDQWDAGPGDDLTLFMESGVRDSDRVLAICTPNYVAKAEAGMGGVGYERMIVTAELVKNIGTNKFIPIVRNSLPERRTPTFLATRMFVDFCDGRDENAEFDVLLRELHKVPPKQKPALGASPFGLSPLGAEAAPRAVAEAAPRAKSRQALSEPRPAVPRAIRKEMATPATTEEGYYTSRDLIVAGAATQWQESSRKIVRESMESLLKWRSECENSPIQSDKDAQILLDAAVDRIGRIVGFSLAAVESGQQAYGDQSGLLFDFLNIRNWPRSGRVWFTNLPTSLVFVFHHLHGALCARTGQFDVALRLAERKVQSFDDNEYRRICSTHKLAGWPQAFDGDSLKGWGYLYAAPSRWKWLGTIFPQAADFQESLIAYRILLNIHELALMLAEGKPVESLKPDETRLDIPLNFALEDRESNRRAFHLLLVHRDQIESIWASRGVSVGTMKAAWPKWMELCEFWASRSTRAVFADAYIAHKKLFDAL